MHNYIKYGRYVAHEAQCLVVVGVFISVLKIMAMDVVVVTAVVVGF